MLPNVSDNVDVPGAGDAVDLADEVPAAPNQQSLSYNVFIQPVVKVA